MITFDDMVNKWLDGVDISTLAPFSAVALRQMAAPRGGTRLIDTIYEALTAQKKRVVALNKALPADLRRLGVTYHPMVVIWTDGQDNASSRVTLPMLAHAIRQMEHCGGNCIFTASGLDAITSGTSMGFAPRRCVQADVGPGAAPALVRALTQATRRGISGLDTPPPPLGPPRGRAAASAPVPPLPRRYAAGGGAVPRRAGIYAGTDARECAGWRRRGRCGGGDAPTA